jgi:sugar phosphate permease
MRQRWLRLLPIMMVTFIISFMDRTNISFAIPTMGKELGLTSSVLGFASGVLFLGYGASQSLGGWIADRGHGRALIAVLLVLWGIAEILQGFVNSAGELVAARFFLGLFEGGIFPTFLLFVKNWFSPDERARANSVWQLCYPLAAVLSGPIAGYILTIGDWRNLFIIEGIFPIVWAAVWWWGIADTPENAKWLKPADRAALRQHLAAASALSTSDGGDAGEKPTVRNQFLRREVLFFTAGVFFWNIGFLGFIIWLPSVISQGRDLSPAATGWLSAAPFVASMIVMQGLAYWSDRTANRRVPALAAVVVCGLALIIGGMTLQGNSLAMNMVLLIIAGGALYGSQPVLWSMPADMLPRSVAGTVMGVINGLGVLGAFLGPYVVGFARGMTGSFASALFAMGLCMFITGLLVSQVRTSKSPRRSALRHIPIRPNKIL